MLLIAKPLNMSIVFMARRLMPWLSSIHIILYILIFLQPSAAYATLNSLKTSGRTIVDSRGRQFLSKGVNLGNWLIPEGYMFNFNTTRSPRSIENLFRELAGPLYNQRFWEQWKARYITRDDIKLIKRSGANVIRVPFGHADFITDSGAIDKSGRAFQYLDRVIRWSKESGIYVILEMHAAPCGQIGSYSDDSYGYPFLFTDEACINQAIEIWRAIAKHYANEATVFGYDILNEPLLKDQDNYSSMLVVLKDLYRRAIRELRAIDKNKIIVLEGTNWARDIDVLAEFTAVKNVVFSFHYYWAPVDMAHMRTYIDFRDKYKVPILLGETGENTNDWISSMLRMMKTNNIGYLFWTYKRMATDRSHTTFQPPPKWTEITDIERLSETDKPIAIAKLRSQIGLKGIQTIFNDLLNNIKFIKSTQNSCLIKIIYRPLDANPGC